MRPSGQETGGGNRFGVIRLVFVLAFASRLARARVPCFNIIFHSSELLPGGSPYTPDEASVSRFLEDLTRLFEHLTTRLGAVGRTYGQFRAEWDARA